MASPHRSHALLAPLAAATFAELRVSVALCGRKWDAVHVVPSIIPFERQHGVEHQRYAYNVRSMARVRRTRATVLGTHAGFCDWFVPVGSRAPVRHFLVAGPFASTPPTTVQLIDRWRWLTNRQGRLSDPEFAYYVSMTLATPVFDGAKGKAFEQLLECFAKMIATEGDAEDVWRKVAGIKTALVDATFVNRMWDAARTMADERTEHIWASPVHSQDLADLGVQRVPEHAIVGLVSRRIDEVDPLDELLRRDGFQRACVDLARSLGNVLSGRVGDHGVVFLVPPEPSDAKTRARLVRVGDRARDLAKRFELTLHLGLEAPARNASLTARYQSALGGAERAVSTGSAIATTRGAETPPALLRDLRTQIAKLAHDRPGDMAARFDRYLEAVAAHAGYNLDLVRAHLEAGFERLVEPLVSQGVVGEKSLQEMWANLERESKAVETVAGLFAAYRRAASDVQTALENPTRGHQERSLRRAVEYVREHASERLTLAAVARVGGFGPNYFAQLFKRRERMTFGTYVRNIRIERAKQMLARTPLAMEQVGQLSGFVSKRHFHRVFKRLIGTTPAKYRDRYR